MSDLLHSLNIQYLLDYEMSRRDFLLDVLAAGGLMATGLSLPRRTWAQADDSEVVKIGYLPIADATALLIAHAKGYFQEEGLRVAQPVMVPSWTQLIQGFFTGKYNLVHFLNPIPIWLRYNHQIPIKIMSWAHINGSAIIVGKHVAARSFADLAGKQVAVPYWYSMHNILLQMALREVGLKPVIKHNYEKLASNEVNLRILPPPLMVWALKARNIDAYIVAEPINAKGELLAEATLLRFTGDMWKNHPCCVICMNEHTVAARPNWTQKIMNAIVRAQGYAQQNKAEVAEILSQQGKNYIPAPVKVLKRAMLTYDTQTYAASQAILHPQWGNGRIDFAPWPFPSATRLLVENMQQTLMGGSDSTFIQQLNADFVVKDLVDYHFVKMAMEKYSTPVENINLENPFERQEVISL